MPTAHDATLPKPRPSPELRFVFHPEQDDEYVHFVNAAAHPFDAAATTLTRRNAWWLAEAALLTYWDAAIAIPRFRAAGLEAQLVDAAGLQVYVAWAPALAIVAFRGTEPDEWSDILDDALFKQVPWEAGAGFVHRGFKGALDRGWPVLGPLVDDLGRTRTVWFTGHSLGAALATLAAARYPNTAGALTLGSPRVGDALFSERYRTRFRGRALRYVNDADLVTQVPPPIPFPSVYAHCGELRHISASGDISHQRPRLDHFFQELFADAASVLDLVEALKSGVLHRAPKLLLDHMPRSYAVDIWNDYVRHGN